MKLESLVTNPGLAVVSYSNGGNGLRRPIPFGADILNLIHEAVQNGVYSSANTLSDLIFR
jgi:hypothetical protein